MKLEFLDEFKDPYMGTPLGRGVFLAGVVLGYMARSQVEGEKDISSAPLFKQLEFGRLNMKALKKLLARVPQLLAAYRESMKYSGYIATLAAEANGLILKGEDQELGVEGNFAFTTGFAGASKYFWKIFGKMDGEKANETTDAE
ncbi:TM1802 family CRISPR-associated protein [Moorella naiadis]|uniref:TM1802 family CRISPR-associated protein n=1 Tax=Moorella naiadis (nom. illeg.) TaxID=3093670 RepID=UPI003D9CA165